MIISGNGDELYGRAWQLVTSTLEGLHPVAFIDVAASGNKIGGWRQYDEATAIDSATCRPSSAQ